MNSKRILPAALLATAQLLCACQSGAAPVSDSSSTGDTTSSEPIETKAEYTSPGVDYGGAEFTILDYDTDEYFWQAATYSDIHAEEENGDPINDAQYKRNRQVEEELNITLKTYPVGGVARFSNASEYRKLILAGDNSVDAAFVFGAEASSLLGEGYLTDLHSIPTLNLGASWWDQNAIDTFTFGGNLEVVTGDISLYTSFSPIMYFYNKNLAEAFKIDDCYDLVRSGKWTYDKVFEYCELVAGDLDGNNIMDENDRYGMAEQLALVSDMLISAGIRYTERDKDGNITLKLNSERTISAIEKVVPFLNDGNTNSIATNYTKVYSNPFYEMHLPMFKNSQILFNFNQLLISFELRAMETDYGILPTPKYDEEQEEYYTSMSTSWMTLLSVPVTNDRPEMTGHVLDALGYYSQQYVTPEYIDTTVRHKSLRDEDSAEMLEIILESKVYDIAQIYNWGGIVSMVNNLGVNNNINFASQYANIESKVLTEMEKTLEQIN